MQIIRVVYLKKKTILCKHKLSIAKIIELYGEDYVTSEKFVMTKHNIISFFNKDLNIDITSRREEIIEQFISNPEIKELSANSLLNESCDEKV